ncbi:MAG: AAA family ATPase [Bacteroidota bacterium]
MQQQKNLQIGVSDFRHLIDEGGYFVDKTLLIKELVDSGFHVSLIPRPRRFGKSLNLSMLKYYFDYRKKDTQPLFEPFQIWQAGERYRQEQGSRPVIHFSLKSGKTPDFEQSKRSIHLTITNVYHSFRWLLEEGTLTETEKSKFNSILSDKADDSSYYGSIKELSKYLYRHSGKKVLILLDEYDAAIHAGFYYDYYDEIITLMKSILGNTFKDNEYLYKGVITGILRVAKESIFSDMNNLGVFTVLSSFFSDKFGFTSEEVRELLSHFGYGEEYAEVKAWYDGYRFGKTEDIYNPWAIVNYIARHTDGFQSYWGNTSSDDIIKSSISDKNNTALRNSVEQLIQGGTITRRLNENITFPDFYSDPTIFWSLLTFSGYLTPAEQLTRTEYILRIPNYEIQILFQEIILTWLRIDLKIRETTMRKMTKGLTENRFAEFEEAFRSIMNDTFSYFDIHTEPERVYQAYVLGLLGMLSDHYVIKSNREAGKGRYDIMLLPKDKSQYGVLMELKQLEKEATEAKIQAALTDALSQIERNQYYQALQAQDISERLDVAIVFVGKEVYLSHQFS